MAARIGVHMQEVVVKPKSNAYLDFPYVIVTIAVIYIIEKMPKLRRHSEQYLFLFSTTQANWYLSVT